MVHERSLFHVNFVFVLWNLIICCSFEKLTFKFCQAEFGNKCERRRTRMDTWCGHIHTNDEFLFVGFFKLLPYLQKSFNFVINLLWRFKISFLSSCLKIEFCILDLEFWNTCYTNGTILFSTQFSSAQFSNVKTFFHFSHTTADNNLLSLLTSFRLFGLRQLMTYGKMVHIRENFKF